MSRRRLGFGFGIALASIGVGVGTAVAVACGSSGGSSSGDLPPTTTTGPSMAPISCNAGCAARPAEGNAALKGGQYGAAFDAYRCGDSPEAAFGAGLTTAVLAVESESANKVLGDLGQTGVKATDVFGPTGWFARYASRMKGTGTITRADEAGAVLETLTLNRGQQRAPSPPSSGTSTTNYLSARFLGTEDLVRISVSYQTTASTPLAPGARLDIGCTTPTGGASYPSVSYSTPTFSCTTSGTTTPTCGTSGALVVTKTGTAVGDPIEYTLDNVLVSCTPKPSTGGTQAAGTPARLKGSLSTNLVSNQPDLTGLPLVLSNTQTSEAVASKVPPGMTLERVIASGSGVAGSLELAACYFNAAGTGSGDGQVFEAPGELLGSGVPLTVTRGDAKVLSAMASLMSAAIVIVQAYKIPLELRGVICGGADSSIPCLSEDESAKRINAAVGALVDRQKIAIARRLVGSALASLSDASAGLGPKSIFVKNAQSSASIDKIQALADKLRESLDKGSVALPYFSPEVKVDLKAFFDNPPDPDKINVDPLTFNAEKKNWTLTEAFFDQAVPASSFNWSGSDNEYTFDNGSSLTLDPMSYRLEGHFGF